MLNKFMIIYCFDRILKRGVSKELQRRKCLWNFCSA